MVVPEPKTFDKGLVFVKDTDILLSGDKWTIIINIALDDYDTLVYMMKTTLKQIRQKIQVQKNPKLYSFNLHWDEINRLNGMVQGLDDDLQGFRKLLWQDTIFRNPGPNNVRTKRGLIDVFGYGMKYLFGTADAQDVKRLSDVCDELHSFKSRMTHAVNHQLTYIRTLDETVKQSTVDIADLAETLRDSICNFSLQLNRVEADLLDTQAAIEKQTKYSAAIREIEMAILELKLSIIQLQEAIDVTSLGQLCSVLIHPYNLSVILQQVSLQLPAGLSMLTGLTVQEMYVYYTISAVHAVATSRNIRLFVDIPLKAADRYFELYQVHSLPFFHRGIGRFIMIDEPFTYLAVAESRQYFAVISPYMLSKCTQQLFTVCPSDMVLKTTTEPNCLIALFLGKTDIMVARCKRLIINETFESVWIRSPDASYWIYSLTTPQRITVQCQEMGSPHTAGWNSQLMLEGTGILPNSSSCYVYAETFKLLPHSLGKTTVSLNKAHIVLPVIETMLTFTEEVVLQSNPSSSVNLQRLDEISARVTSRSQMKGAEVARIVSIFQDADVPQHTISWLWVICIIVMFTVIGSLWPLWLKIVKLCLACTQTRMRTCKQPSDASVSQNSDVNGTELQVIPATIREKTMPGTSSEIVPETSSSVLTEFVKHGVVTGDYP